MTQAYTQLIETVHDVRRAWRARRACEGAMLVAAAFIGATAVAAAMDRLLAPGILGRLMLAGIVYGAALGTLWRALVQPLVRRHSDDYFAALLEQRVPELRNRFINAFQLGRAHNGSVSPLVQAIVSEGAQLTDTVRPGVAAHGPALKRVAVGPGVALAVAVAFAAIAGPAATASVQRVLMPTANIAPFTWTSVDLEVLPGDRVLEGSPVTVTVATSGRAVEHARVHWQQGDDPTRSARLTAEPDGSFRHEIPSVDARLTLHATAGDGRSATHTIEVDPRPRIERMSATYDYPAYTGLSDRRVTEFDGHLQALRGSVAQLDVRVTEPLEVLSVRRANDRTLDATSIDSAGLAWRVTIELDAPDSFRLHMRDRRGYEITSRRSYTIHPERDASPTIAFRQPRRDVAVTGDEAVRFEIVARDGYGLDRIELRGRLADQREGDDRTLATWQTGAPGQTQMREALERTAAALDVPPGERMTIWAVAWDRNDVTGPGRAQTRRLTLHHLQPETSDAEMHARLADYVRTLTRLLRDQQRNRAETLEHAEPPSLIERQNAIRRDTRRLAERMDADAFPAPTIIAQLHELARDAMAEAIVTLERYGQADGLQQRQRYVDTAVGLQDEIIEQLERILVRLTRAAEVRQRLRRAADEEPEHHREVLDVLEEMVADLDAFLSEVRDLDEAYDRLPKRPGRDVDDAELERDLASLDEQMGEWREWFADSVDAITKLPDGFVPDGFLADELGAIFEEIERQPRQEATEIATPLEEGIKALAEEVKEDFEMWMMHEPDSNRWVMEDPTEGAFDVPDADLPSSLQDMIGDLIEDVEDYDEQADDVTGAWGGNLQMGWDIADGPISSFAALGKTGNQLPNASEMSGRSGSGRRGRASGQMVGAESRGMEGRPTPARVTAEPYEHGMPEVLNQLDPHGATGGGKLTGAGQRGLQGGTLPPELEADMQRLAEHQALLRERTQLLAREFERHGRPLTQLHRALDLMQGAEQDYRDLRYDDAARQRKAALEALRDAGRAVDRGMTLALDEARQLPDELRDEIGSAIEPSMPAGYEDLVGAYYRALSEQE